MSKRPSDGDPPAGKRTPTSTDAASHYDTDHLLTDPGTWYTDCETFDMLVGLSPPSSATTSSLSAAASSSSAAAEASSSMSAASAPFRVLDDAPLPIAKVRRGPHDAEMAVAREPPSPLLGLPRDALILLLAMLPFHAMLAMAASCTEIRRHMFYGAAELTRRRVVNTCGDAMVCAREMVLCQMWILSQYYPPTGSRGDNSHNRAILVVPATEQFVTTYELAAQLYTHYRAAMDAEHVARCFTTRQLDQLSQTYNFRDPKSVRSTIFAVERARSKMLPQRVTQMLLERKVVDNVPTSVLGDVCDVVTSVFPFPFHNSVTMFMMLSELLMDENETCMALVGRFRHSDQVDLLATHIRTIVSSFARGITVHTQEYAFSAAVRVFATWQRITGKPLTRGDAIALNGILSAYYVVHTLEPMDYLMACAASTFFRNVSSVIREKINALQDDDDDSSGDRKGNSRHTHSALHQQRRRRLTANIPQHVVVSHANSWLVKGWECGTLDAIITRPPIVSTPRGRVTKPVDRGQAIVSARPLWLTMMRNAEQRVMSGGVYPSQLITLEDAAANPEREQRRRATLAPNNIYAAEDWAFAVETARYAEQWATWSYGGQDRWCLRTAVVGVMSANMPIMALALASALDRPPALLCTHNASTTIGAPFGLEVRRDVKNTFFDITVALIAHEHYASTSNKAVLMMWGALCIHELTVLAKFRGVTAIRTQYAESTVGEREVASALVDVMRQLDGIPFDRVNFALVDGTLCFPLAP